MHADLVPPSCLQGQFHQGPAFISFQNPVMGDRVPGGAATGDTEDFEWVRLVNQRTERALIGNGRRPSTTAW